MSRKSVLTSPVLSSLPPNSELVRIFEKQRGQLWFNPYFHSIGLVCEFDRSNSELKIKVENSKSSRRFLCFFVLSSFALALLAAFLDSSLASILIMVVGFSIGGLVWIYFLTKVLHSYAEKFIQELLDEQDAHN